MSEFSPSPVAGDAAVHPQAALTPAAIDAILSDFRSWLEQVAAAPPAPAAETVEAIDLHTLLGQFIALRHEVNLQTKSARAQQEQNAETLCKLSETLKQLTQARAEVEQSHWQGQQQKEEELLRPLLKALVDLDDSLSLGGREVQRLQDTISQSIQQLAIVPEAVYELPLPVIEHWLIRGLKRLFPDRPNDVESALPPTFEAEHLASRNEAVGRLRHLLDSLVTGYTMSLQRVERALRQHGLEPIPAVGQPFDPEQMEVVEAVTGSGKPAGAVVGEVRRGYLWQGRVFRYAQVRVAKSN